jgi:hypothetical protein
MRLPPLLQAEEDPAGRARTASAAPLHGYQQQGANGIELGGRETRFECAGNIPGI